MCIAFSRASPCSPTIYSTKSKKDKHSYLHCIQETFVTTGAHRYVQGCASANTVTHILPRCRNDVTKGETCTSVDLYWPSMQTVYPRGCTMYKHRRKWNRCRLEGKYFPIISTFHQAPSLIPWLVRSRSTRSFTLRKSGSLLRGMVWSR